MGPDEVAYPPVVHVRWLSDQALRRPRQPILHQMPPDATQLIPHLELLKGEQRKRKMNSMRGKTEKGHYTGRYLQVRTKRDLRVSENHDDMAGLRRKDED